MIGQGQCDLGIAQSHVEDRDIRYERLFDLDVFCLLPKGHPLTRRQVIRPRDFHQANVLSLSPGDNIRRQFEVELDRSNVIVSSLIDITLGSTLSGMVEQGAGIGLVDSETVRVHAWRQVEIRPFEPQIKIPIYLMRSRRHPSNRLLDRFVSFVLDHPLKPPLPDT